MVVTWPHFKLSCTNLTNWSHFNLRSLVWNVTKNGYTAWVIVWISTNIGQPCNLGNTILCMGIQGHPRPYLLEISNLVICTLQLLSKDWRIFLYFYWFSLFVYSDFVYFYPSGTPTFDSASSPSTWTDNSVGADSLAAQREWALAGAKGPGGKYMRVRQTSADSSPQCLTVTEEVSHRALEWNIVAN